MAESTPSASKTLSWLLAVLLIGVVALYSWYNGKQAEIMSGKDEEIARSAERLAGSEQMLGQALETEKGLQAEIDTLSTTHEAEKQDLLGKLDAAAQANKALQVDMEALKDQHAQTLAAAKEQADQAYAELQGRLDAANERIADLGADIEEQKLAMADAVARHEAKLEEVETAHEAEKLQLAEEANQKSDFYRTALEGSDPERAAQLDALELQIQSDREAIEQARSKIAVLEEIEVDLNGRLARANQTVTDKEQALGAAGQQIQVLQGELETARKQLQASGADLAKTKADAAAAMQSEKETHAARMSAAEDKISDLSGKLQAEMAALAALRQRHNAKVAELTDSLENTRKALAGTQTELSVIKDAAAKAEASHEQLIGEAEQEIAVLSETLQQNREKAARDQETSKLKGEQQVAYVREVYTEFSKLGGRHTDRGMLLSLAEDDLRFRISKADLPEGEVPSLDWIAELLVRHPKLTALVEGHTDSKGRPATNLELSQRRADAVSQALIERGVPAARITSKGIGAERPIADNDTSAGRRENRRVEIYVIERSDSGD
jgi:outer membrane protein OmpA-like peptidoglycan-associated protein